MSFSCFSCGKFSCNSKKGLKNHLHACEAFRDAPLVPVLSKRERDELQAEQEVQKRNRLDEFDRDEVDQDTPDVSILDTMPPELPRSPTPIPEPAARSVRSGRAIRFPKQYDDFLPGSKTPLAHIPSVTRACPKPYVTDEPDEGDAPSSTTGSPSPSPPPWYQTPLDDFGLFRCYPTPPSSNPDARTALGGLCDSASLDKSSSPEVMTSASQDLADNENQYTPFSSLAAAAMMGWHYNGNTTKSGEQTNELARTLAGLPIDLQDFSTFNFDAENKCMDDYVNGKSSHVHSLGNEDSWTRSSVKIKLPHEKTKFRSEEDAPDYEVPNIHHRDIVDIIKSVFEDPVADSFHHTPFEQYWKPYDDDDTIYRVYGEAYSSDAMLEAYEEVRSLSIPDDEESLERIVTPLMFASDSTHLASFGPASVWPLYMLFGNQSKYVRCRPTSNACHHLAYIPTLPEDFQEKYKEIFGESASAAVITHCKRELMHAVWEKIMNDRLIHAYRYGIVVLCSDGKHRRIFPRFFTYSADYPEKILLANIRNLGPCPCPRCLIKMDEVVHMGDKNDDRRRAQVRKDTHARQTTVEHARRAIFAGGRPVNSKSVRNILQATSSVPTRNAFSSRLAEFGFCFFLMFVVDLLHDFELGVWKAIFTHLIRILVAVGGDAIPMLDARYRAVPTFGRGTIRKFRKEVSAMKHPAARDFEDLLQCAMPTFEGLLNNAPEDKIIQDLLFDLATWHAYAKLRLHTDVTVEAFRVITRLLGQTVRRFLKKVCSAWDTRELTREYTARGRRHQARTEKSNDSSSAGKKRRAGLGPKKRKTLNLSTYKWHALGHYPDLIPSHGTHDGYSTQTSELEHRRSKRRFARTSKNNFIPQLAKQDVRERLMRRVQRRLDRTRRKANPTIKPRKRTMASDSLPFTDPTAHYHIAESSREYVDIAEWLGDNIDDPATQDFLPQLQSHLLARLRGVEYNGDEHEFTDDELDLVIFAEDRLYKHNVLRVNYTSYDLRRQQDSMNPRTRADIMVMAHENDDEGNPHPFWYARIIGIFHAMVQLNGSRERPVRMDFLWVRWFGRDLNTPSGFAARRLPRVGFFEEGIPGAFGFLNPQEVIRGVHMIPAFANGRTDQLLGHSIARQPQEEDKDWQWYYVNMFVDRDMFMRFRGGGIGHLGTRHWDEVLLADNHGGQLNPRARNNGEGEHSDSTDTSDEDRGGDRGDSEDDNGLAERNIHDGRDDGQHDDGDDSKLEGNGDGSKLEGNGDSDGDGSDELESDGEESEGEGYGNGSDEEDGEGRTTDSEEDLDPIEENSSDSEDEEDLFEEAGFAPL